MPTGYEFACNNQMAHSAVVFFTTVSRIFIELCFDRTRRHILILPSYCEFHRSLTRGPGDRQTRGPWTGDLFGPVNPWTLPRGLVDPWTRCRQSYCYGQLHWYCSCCCFWSYCCSCFRSCLRFILRWNCLQCPKSCACVVLICRWNAHIGVPTYAFAHAHAHASTPPFQTHTNIHVHSLQHTRTHTHTKQSNVESIEQTNFKVRFSVSGQR